jgi:ribonucleoside-diphosphate reductase alpha chain
MPRPKILDGKTTKIKVGCGSLFITLNYDKDKKPFEIFLSGSKLGGCEGNQNAISRLISLCFQNNISVDTVIEQLELIKCHSCTRAKAKLTTQEDIKNFPTSCGDAVSKFLKEIK